MIIERRQFLRGLVSVPIAIGLPALAESRALQREPYVRVRQFVGNISLNLHPQPTFIGDAQVVDVGDWNGQFYPCLVDAGGWCGPLPFPDHDLCILHEEYPPDFWRHAENRRKWPNVHAFVRFKRFGEHPNVMRARMEAVRLGKPFEVMP